MVTENSSNPDKARPRNFIANQTYIRAGRAFPRSPHHHHGRRAAALLFEQSRQAAFLKPTVITLIYGLGFGIVVVLMITPTMIAIQQDFGLRLRSLRRLVRLAASRRRPAQS